MALYAVTYDLNKNKNYPKLWSEMERLGGHKAAESFYFLNVTSNSAQKLRDHLRDFVDEDDTLVVVPMLERPSTWKAKNGTKDWLDQHF